MTSERRPPAGAAPQALWLVAPGCYALRPAEAPAPGPAEARVEATTSGISRGTERLVFEGRVPPSQHTRMRAPRQEGAFPAPVKYGYASVGVVTGLGPEAAWPAAIAPGATLAPGARVFCLFPHQSAYTVAADALVPVPDDVSDARAVLAANMETALNGCWDAGLTVGQRVVVVGAGVLGLLVASLAQATPGTE
ncbi:MAG: dehydrogenase, partial [Myxococcota bacterium]